MTMPKIFVPVLAGLFLCGAAAGALIATNAHAQTETHEPAMVMAQNSTVPAPMQRHGTAADIAARQKARCENRYALAVGRMAYLEARLNLTGSQQSLFSAWRSVRLNIARRDADACARRDLSQNRRDLSPVDRMTRMEDRLKQRIADLDAERPAFAALYEVLSPDQREWLTPRRHRMMHPGMNRRGMMGREPMRPGPAAGQPPAPQQP